MKRADSGKRKTPYDKGGRREMVLGGFVGVRGARDLRLTRPPSGKSILAVGGRCRRSLWNVITCAADHVPTAVDYRAERIA